MARQLNNILKYEYYYSNSPYRQRVLSDFLNGKIRVIIATSSLGLGLDLSNIRLIIHIDQPYTLYDYAQETRRAGRDNSPSEALLLLSKASNSTSDHRLNSKEQFENDVISRYITSSCRRASLNSYLNGNESEKCDSTEIPCDICQPEYSSKSIFHFFHFLLYIY